ncbi:MAG: hypothetical protein JNN08_07050 [Bryobacterales bacterium]|nr:hypothetical protein [Bryobacterales bacterium]
MEARTRLPGAGRLMNPTGEFVDWLRAMKELEPADEEARDALTRALGFQLMDATSSRRGSTDTAAGARRRRPAEEDSSSPQTPVAPTERKTRRRVQSVLTLANSSRNPAPAWLYSTEPLEPPAESHLKPALPLEPLFSHRTARAILSGALATPSLSGPLDLAKVIEAVSRAEFLSTVPCQKLPTLVRGVQLLLDSGESMQPFAKDQSILRAALTSVVGRDRTEVVYFEGSPLRGTGTGLKEDWADYRVPAAATPVVLVTDLGIGRPPSSAAVADESEWLEFARFVARAQCPVAALVPYPTKRWPPALSRHMTIIQWDRTTTAASVRRSVGAGLTVKRDV